MTGTLPARVVVFRVAAQLYAVDVMVVERVVRHSDARPVPLGSSDIEGVLDVEGQLVPLVDLRSRLDAAPPVTTAQTRTVLVRGETGTIGYAVDQVLDVRVTEGAEAAPTPPSLQHPQHPVFLGTIRRGTEMVLVVDADALTRLSRPTAGTSR